MHQACRRGPSSYPNPLPISPLKSGELVTEQRMQYLERVVQAVRRETVEMDREMRARAAEGGAAPAGPKGLPPSVAPAGEDELGVVVSLSVGELSTEQYERLYR